MSDFIEVTYEVDDGHWAYGSQVELDDTRPI